MSPFLSACPSRGEERLTPEFGYAVHPSSAVATRVSMMVSENRQKESWWVYKETTISIIPNCIQGPVITVTTFSEQRRRGILQSVFIRLRSCIDKRRWRGWKGCLKASVTLLNSQPLRPGWTESYGTYFLSLQVRLMYNHFDYIGIFLPQIYMNTWNFHAQNESPCPGVRQPFSRLVRC